MEEPQYTVCSPPSFSSPTPKNFIFVVGDGNGPTAITLTRLMKKAPLVVDGYFAGTVRTASDDSYITDSAAAATALACGIKTYNGAVGVFPGNLSASGSIMEAAKSQGWSTGIITTAFVSDATPAGFTAHSQDRSYQSFIAAQQVTSPYPADIILGGGRNDFINGTLELAIERGYNFIDHATQLANVSLPVLGLFAPERLTYDIEKELAPHQPTLLEMTKRSIELLEEQNNPNGFFLLVEASGIDTNEHSWDAAAAYREGLMLDKTMEYIMNFAKKNEDTLVLVTADHETSGISIGRDYSKVFYPEFLEAQTRSTSTMGELLLGSKDRELIRNTLKTYAKIDITEDEITKIEQSPTKWEIRIAIGSTVASRARIGFTTADHTGVDVNLYGYGPGMQNFCGNIENTDIPSRVAQIFGWNTFAITESLVDLVTKP
eukprot:TRINITY_DN2611_c0_g1_i2.p1 TRINITY_DN2611_c0_g1~~TRINITY_DN2611_c0_g1_i2.p1  ORF type:complete len:433 (+),score=88.69 TRINITY_DN2611_c0_g1_i2:376-1674(+)